MTVNATDEEREIMKDLYVLFEQAYDMAGTDDEWMRFIRDVVQRYEKYQGMEKKLAFHLFMGLINYKEEQQKARMAEALSRPVQISV